MLSELNNATVPVASGNVIVLSAVGSVTVKDVSKSLAVDPSNVIFPLPSNMELAPLPATRLVDVKEVNPEMVEAVVPSAIPVAPIVKDELANPLLGIEDALVNIVPVSFGKVRVLSPPVASAAVNIISFASAVDPSNIIFPLPISIALAASSVPAIRVVEAKEVKPAKVPTVAPSPTAVLPIVKDELAIEEFGMLARPNAPDA